MEQLDLCKILKGHEGETFYSPLYGKLILIGIKEGFTPPIKLYSRTLSVNIDFMKDGKVYAYSPECMLFPSKDQRNWKKWDEENNIPKTWSQFMRFNPGFTSCCGVNIKSVEVGGGAGKDCADNSLEKSALALLKIRKLIEVSYGGNPKLEEKLGVNTLYEVFVNRAKCITVEGNAMSTNLVAFYTREQAEKFISYDENIQLLKDYYMI